MQRPQCFVCQRPYRKKLVWASARKPAKSIFGRSSPRAVLPTFAEQRRRSSISFTKQNLSVLRTDVRFYVEHLLNSQYFASRKTGHDVRLSALTSASFGRGSETEP